jgi:hypothetical protein
MVVPFSTRAGFRATFDEGGRQVRRSWGSGARGSPAAPRAGARRLGWVRGQGVGWGGDSDIGLQAGRGRPREPEAGQSGRCPSSFSASRWRGTGTSPGGRDRVPAVADWRPPLDGRHGEKRSQNIGEAWMMDFKQDQNESRAEFERPVFDGGPASAGRVRIGSHAGGAGAGDACWASSRDH